MAVTWDPLNCASSITLSNGNLTASYDSLSSFDNLVRVTTSVTAKVYWELVLDSIASPGPGQVGLGLVTGSSELDDEWLGNTGNNSLGYFFNGNIYQNGSQIETLQAWAAGSVIGFALDRPANLFWLRVGVGNWNDSASADPATGAEGLDVSALSGSIYPAVNLYTIGDVATARFLTASWTGSAPSGFVELSDIAAPTLRIVQSGLQW